MNQKKRSKNLQSGIPSQRLHAWGKLWAVSSLPRWFACTRRQTTSLHLSPVQADKYVRGNLLQHFDDVNWSSLALSPGHDDKKSKKMRGWNLSHFNSYFLKATPKFQMGDQIFAPALCDQGGGALLLCNDKYPFIFTSIVLKLVLQSPAPPPALSPTSINPHPLPRALPRAKNNGGST